MSLIQDALKRKTEEQHVVPPQPVSPPAPPVEPPVPAPVQPGPASDLPPPHSSERKLFFILVTAFVLILLVIGISIYFVVNAPRPVPVIEPIKENELPAAIIESITPVATPPVAVKETKQKDKWPELNFSGSASAGNQRLAIINGRMLSAGSRIDGVKVLEIGKAQVLVEYKGEKRVLRVGDE